MQVGGELMISSKNPYLTVVTPILLGPSYTPIRNRIDDWLMIKDYGNDYSQIELTRSSKKLYGKFVFPPDVESGRTTDLRLVENSGKISPMKINEIWRLWMVDLDHLVDTHDFRELIYYIDYDYGVGWKRYTLICFKSHSGHEYNCIIVKFDNEWDAIQYKLAIS